MFNFLFIYLFTIFIRESIFIAVRESKFYENTILVQEKFQLKLQLNRLNQNTTHTTFGHYNKSKLPLFSFFE